MKSYILCVLTLAATAAAQEVTHQTVEHQRKIQVETVTALTGQAPMIARIGGQLNPVKGAPYSAEATTESVQILADGNRIVNKTSNKSYRDSDGRTRVEITPNPAGAWMPDTKPFSVTMIDDPVSGEHITLNNNNKQATRFSMKSVTHAAAARVAGEGDKLQTFTTRITTTAGDPEAPVPVPMPMPIPMPMVGAQSNAIYINRGGEMRAGMFIADDMKADKKTESLGKQVIEGVECTGTKEITTIPAGAVGNERALETVTEHWYSPDLQQEVLTKTTDPRFGETTYRLTNIVRAEQPRSLFEIPSDFKVDEPTVNYKVTKDGK